MTPDPAPRPAAFFDLDKTIISGSSSLALSRPFLAGGLLTRTDALRGLYAQLGYLSFGADHDRTEWMKDRLADLSRGWDVARTEAVVAAALEGHIRPALYPEALELIAEHRAAGQDVVIVSASSETVVRPIAELLGADHVIASRATVADGSYTGTLDFYAYGPTKASAIREMAELHGYDLAASYAYSDSATDLPMLECVGRPVAVNPDRTLRREALARGWQVLDFVRPVPARSPRRCRVLLGLVGLAVVVVLAERWRRRRRP